MLTRYAELAPISATKANTTNSNMRSRGPTALTYFFFGNGAGTDSTELIVVDIRTIQVNRTLLSDILRESHGLLRRARINSTLGMVQKRGGGSLRQICGSDRTEKSSIKIRVHSLFAEPSTRILAAIGSC